MGDADEQPPGRIVAGRYRIDRELGRGGMGVVWLAVDTLIERQVALKELRAPAGVTEGDETSFVERAMREGRNAGRLNHPSVVAVYDVIAPGGDDDAVYIVMEYVQAPTLHEVIEEQGSLPASRVAAMGLGVLDAIAAAHTMGIVHRDIKPGNVLVREGDRIKLTDFGIALAAEDTRLTRSGVIGTHAYLAPECFDTGHAGPAADLWALGATLFHAVAGRAPFDRDTTTAMLRAILFEDVPPPPCEPRLAEVITGLLTRPVEERFTSDVARQKLEPIAAEPSSAAPVADAPPAGGAGQSSWEAQATGVHRPDIPSSSPAPSSGQTWGQPAQPAASTWGQPAQPTAQPTGQSWGQPTQPGAQPSPYTTSQPGQAAMPSSGHGGSGGYNTSYGSTSSWGGGQQPPPRNNTPWVVGGGIAAVALLLLIVIMVSSGGDDDGGGGSGGGSGYTDAMRDDFVGFCSSEVGSAGGAGIDVDSFCECGWNEIVASVPLADYQAFADAYLQDSSTTPPESVQAALSECIPDDLNIPSS